jgi:hypothetical protein
MSAINIGDEVWYKGSQGAADAEGAILSQRGRVEGLRGPMALVSWWDPQNNWRPAVSVPAANLVRVEDLVPQNEPARAPKPPTVNAPDAL